MRIQAVAVQRSAFVAIRRSAELRRAVRALVVAGRDRLEALLAGGVPDLQLDLLAVRVLDGAHLEIYPNGRDVRRAEGVVGEPLHERGFADAAVADDEELCGGNKNTRVRFVSTASTRTTTSCASYHGVQHNNANQNDE